MPPSLVARICETPARETPARASDRCKCIFEHNAHNHLPDFSAHLLAAGAAGALAVVAALAALLAVAPVGAAWSIAPANDRNGGKLVKVKGNELCARGPSPAETRRLVLT